MKNRLGLHALALSAVLMAAGCRFLPTRDFTTLFGNIHARQDQKEAAALFAELGGDDGFFQICHYLYRWYLDENDFKRSDPAFDRQLWIRRVQVVTDVSDKSRFMEVVFPSIGVTVTLKKTDYRIPELKLDIKSGGYRIVRISREPHDASEAGDYARLDFDPAALDARLFQERAQAVYPSDELLARMKQAVAKEVAALALPVARQGEYTVYFAPVHAVANEIWAYWEEGKLLFHFTSDIDLNNPAVWAHDEMGVSIYDTFEQTVVSFEEKPGEERYITRDQVGRALYNCMVLGRKSSIQSAR